jgi:hypothetical protein
MKSVQEYIKILENIETGEEEQQTDFKGPFTVGRLIQILSKADPNMPIQVTMNQEYQNELDKVDISGNYVLLGDW